MSKEVATVDEKALAVANEVPESNHFVGKNDLMIPKILVIQKMSEKVGDKTSEAEVGDMRDTANDEKFGDEDTPLPFIPVDFRTSWVEYEVGKDGKKGDWIRNVPIDASNDGLPYKDAAVIRDRTHEVYVILPEHVKTGTDFPHILSFRVSSLQGGQVVITQINTRNKMMGKPPWHAAMEMSIKEKTNDQGTFFVQRCKLLRESTAEEKIAARKWYDVINAKGTVVSTDNSDLKREARTAAATNSSQF